MKLYLGIDPGANGAAAIIADTTGELLAVRDLPYIGKRLTAAVLHGWILEQDGQIEAFVEEAQAMPGNGAVAMFNYGTGYGTILGVLAACEIPYHTVRASTWKRALGLTKDKTASRRRASELWPKEAHLFTRAKDDGRAEAALIALYGMSSS